MNKGLFSRVGILASVFGLVLAGAVSSPGLAAQQPGRATWRAGSGLSVEKVIRLADELELNEAQRGRLEAIRVELLEMRTNRATQAMALMSEIQAGMREREAVRQEAAGFAEGARETPGGVRGRIQEILTEEQRGELQQLNRRAAWRDRGGRNGARLDRMRGLSRRGEMDRGRGGQDSRGPGRRGGR